MLEELGYTEEQLHTGEVTEEEVMAKANSFYRKITVHSPHLVEMQPAMVLYRGVENECTRELDGKCNTCDFYRGHINNEEGTVFAYMTFEGFCLKTDEEKLMPPQKEVLDKINDSEKTEHICSICGKDCDCHEDTK